MATTAPIEPTPSTTLPLDPNLFPFLTPEQLKRAAGYGRKRSVVAGEVLFDVGGQNLPIFIVTGGRLEIVRPSGKEQDFVTALEPGQFTGEVSTLSGQPALVRTHAVDSGEVIEIDH